MIKEAQIRDNEPEDDTKYDAAKKMEILGILDFTVETYIEANEKEMFDSEKRAKIEKKMEKEKVKEAEKAVAKE